MNGSTASIGTDDARRGKRAYRLKEMVEGLDSFVSVERHPLYSEYVDLVDKMKAFNFIDENNIVTGKGRMVPTLVGCDDVLTLVESWMHNVLPRDSPTNFVVALSCFLQNKRHKQPKDRTGIYEKLCALQKHVGNVDELGSLMMEPMRLWMEGKNVVDICSDIHDASPGHVVKTVQRTIQLLQQLQDVAAHVNDTVLESLCDKSIRTCTRGLPFVQSMFLK